MDAIAAVSAGMLAGTAPTSPSGGARAIHGVFVHGYKDGPDAQSAARTGRPFGRDELGDRRGQDTHGQETEW